MSARRREGGARNDRVRVILGDAALIEPIARQAISELVDPAAGGLDLELVRLPDDSIDRVESALRQVGMFAPGRCVVLKGALEDADDLERLLAVLEKGFDAECAIVIATAKLDGRSRLYRWLTENARVEDLRFERKNDGRGLSVEEIGEFVRARVVACGLPVPDERTLSAIIERAGTDLGELGNEIDRVCLTSREGERLTAALVEKMMRDMASAWVFGFTDALFDRRSSEALEIVDHLLAQGDAPLRIVATVATRVADILAAAEYARAAELPLLPSQSSVFVRATYPTLSASAKRRFNRPYAAFHAFRFGQRLGVGALKTLHRRTLELDLALKSGGGEARHLFASFVTASCARSA
jgi:DNA polymerase-3 subunit delta